MFRTFTDRAKAFSFAIVVHAVFVAVLLLSFDWSPDPIPQSKSREVDPIQAVVIDEKKIQAELAEIENRKRTESEAEKARLRKLEKQAEAARKRRQKEERKLAAAKKKFKEEQERQRKEKVKKEAARKQEAERRKREKAAKEAERKRKEAEERQRKAEEKRKKEEAVRKKQEEERKRQEAEQVRQRKLAADKAKRERQRRLNRYRLQYITDIRSAIEHNWIRPPGMAKGLECKLKVTQIPGGEVADVKVISSSGNPAFDRSAVAAVYKASPLPKPRDPSMFDRNIVLIFNPEN